MAVEPQVKSAKTTLELVEALVDLDGATVTELAEEIDRPTSTVHDYLKTLETEGYVIREGESYHTSARFLELGTRRRKQMPLYQMAKPELERLANEIGEHACLMTEENGLGVLTCTVKGEKAVQVNTYGGARSKLHMTAPGKSILAHFPEGRRDEILERRGLTRRTDNTITSRESLEEELGRIRERGYATDDQEMFEGMRAVAAPVLQPSGQVLGSIGVYGPVNRLDNERFTEHIPQNVLQAANVVQVNITYA
jgi:DNA-binding IclR family transcriptional regulator